MEPGAPPDLQGLIAPVHRPGHAVWTMYVSVPAKEPNEWPRRAVFFLRVIKVLKINSENLPRLRGKLRAKVK